VTTLDLALHPSDTLPAITIRAAGERDRAALAQMFARCTVQTRYRRFHGHVKVLPARYLDEALSGSPAHVALVAVVAVASSGPADGPIVALASCRVVAQGVADLGVLVEDGWQRLGIGNALLREIAAHASRAGIGRLTAQVLAEQSWILRLLTSYGSSESVTKQGVLDVTVQLSGRTP
jgi:GNAT superfamily N-acetyltransferase